MANGTGLQFTLQLADHHDLDLAVINFSLEEALSQPFTLKVRSASRDGSPGSGSGQAAQVPALPREAEGEVHETILPAFLSSAKQLNKLL